jgi:hypothetical protein
MDDLPHLASLIHQRNTLEQRITALTGRPAHIGHLGEYIASRIFAIALEPSATNKGFDGRFTRPPLQGHTVNIKWYAFLEGILDINPAAVPDHYLVLSGPRQPAQSSRDHVRPWTIAHVFLFDGPALVGELQRWGVKIGIAASVRREYWEAAELYPRPQNPLLPLSPQQHVWLQLFSPTRIG